MDKCNNSYKSAWVKQYVWNNGRYPDRNSAPVELRVLADENYDKLMNYKETFAGYDNKLGKKIIEENEKKNIVFINKYMEYKEPQKDMIPEGYISYTNLSNPQDAKKLIEEEDDIKRLFFFNSSPYYELKNTLVIYI